jgi:hypothetical protein
MANRNNGLRNENFVDRLRIDGSTAIQTKNEFGVHIFSGSVSDDGVIGSKLIKPKYNEDEIEKSIDTTIIELIPVVPPEVPDTVLRSVYNVALDQIADLTEQVADLNEVVLNLQANITELEIVTQSLRVQIDANDLVVASLQNQNEQLGLRVQSSITDLQNSIQRATSEAIQRTSLTARNESLLQEIAGLRTELEATKDRLEDTIKELTREASIGAELSAGAYGGNNLTARATPINDSSISEIAWRGRPRNNWGSEDTKWINGKTLSIFNAADESVTVSFEQGVDFLTNIPPITVRPKSFGNVTLSVNISKVEKFITPNGRDVLETGDLIISSPDTTFSIPMELQIQRGAQYKRPS